MIYLFIHFIVLSRANKGITNDVYFPRCELYTGVEEAPQLCFIPHAAVQFSREAVLPYGFEIVVAFLYPSLTFFPFPSSRQGETKMFPKLAGASEGLSNIVTQFFTTCSTFAGGCVIVTDR